AAEARACGEDLVQPVAAQSPLARFTHEARNDGKRSAFVVELPQRVVVLAGARRPERDHLAVAAHRLELEGLDRETRGEPGRGQRVVCEARGHEREPTPR